MERIARTVAAIRDPIAVSATATTASATRTSISMKPSMPPAPPARRTRCRRIVTATFVNCGATTRAMNLRTGRGLQASHGSGLAFRAGFGTGSLETGERDNLDASREPIDAYPVAGARSAQGDGSTAGHSGGEEIDRAPCRALIA